MNNNVYDFVALAATGVSSVRPQVVAGTGDMSLASGQTVSSYRRFLNTIMETGLKPMLYRKYATNWNVTDIVLIRHDVDHDLEAAIEMAQIEADMGIASTYFLLHPGDYGSLSNYYGSIRASRIWHTPALLEAAKMMTGLGHEIGIHTDVAQLSVHARRPMAELLAEELDWFRTNGIPVVGTASHGSDFVRKHGMTNYEIFAECRRPRIEYGRTITVDGWDIPLNSVSHDELGLMYEAYHLPRNISFADSGGRLSIGLPDVPEKKDFAIVTDAEYEQFADLLRPVKDRRMTALVHPNWWRGPNTAKLTTPTKPTMPLRVINPSPSKKRGKKNVQTDNATISLASVRAEKSDSSFPRDLIAGCESAICFYSAPFYGKYDVIHLYERGEKDLWLCDLDKDKLETMMDIYRPVVTKALAGDPLGAAQKIAESGKHVDIVTIDPPTRLAFTTAIEHLDTFAMLSSRFIIAKLCGVHFESMGIEATAEALQQYINNHAKTHLTVDRIILRNAGSQKGVYWVVFKK